MTKSSDRRSDFVRGHTSGPYNRAGMHLFSINSIMISSEAVLPNLLSILFAARQKEHFALCKEIFNCRKLTI